MPFYEYRIDLYGYSPVAKSTVAVELKLRKWKRAFEQARVYQLCSDFVFIALPEVSVPLVDTELLTREGIGLIAVGRSKCRIVIPAAQSGEVRRHYREPFIEMLEGETHGGSGSKSDSSVGNSRRKGILREARHEI
jgi:hypothetical protein